MEQVKEVSILYIKRKGANLRGLEMTSGRTIKLLTLVLAVILLFAQRSYAAPVLGEV